MPLAAMRRCFFGHTRHVPLLFRVCTPPAARFSFGYQIVLTFVVVHSSSMLDELMSNEQLFFGLVQVLRKFPKETDRILCHFCYKPKRVTNEVLAVDCAKRSQILISSIILLKTALDALPLLFKAFDTEGINKESTSSKEVSTSTILPWPVIVGEIANFAAYAFTPAILVTPLGALSIIFSAVLAHFIFKERLHIFGVLGCVLCVVGSTTIVLAEAAVVKRQQKHWSALNTYGLPIKKSVLHALDTFKTAMVSPVYYVMFTDLSP
ncbi:hypothetical protein Dimus_002206 [Dionaea muscipula]